MQSLRKGWDNMLGASVASLALGFMAGTTGTAVAGDATLVDGQGFEAPAYAAGDLTGQTASTLDGAGTSPWITFGPGSGSAVVQSTVVASGSQALQVDRAANSDDRWAVEVSTPLTDRFVNITWDMNVDLPSTAAGFGPFFGVEAYDSTGGVARIGSLGMDAATGEIIMVDDLGIFIPDNSPILLESTWYEFRLELDYLDGIVTGYVDGAAVGSHAFETPGVTGFTDADIIAISAGGDPDSLAAAGTAYFDNYRVTVTDVPEPAGLAALSAAALGLLRRRSA